MPPKFLNETLFMTTLHATPSRLLPVPKHLTACLIAGALSAGSVWAHGNVTPTAVETKGLTPIKEAGVPLDADGWAAP